MFETYQILAANWQLQKKINHSLWKSQTISKEEIYDVKVRKFSIIKSAGGVLGTYGLIVLVLPVILVIALLI